MILPLLQPKAKPYELVLWHNNGPEDVFDPWINFPAGYNPYLVMSVPGASGETIVPVTSGVAIDFRPQAAGPHRVVLYGVPWEKITQILLQNDECVGDLSDWALPASVTYLYLFNNSFTGDLSDWALPASFVELYLHNNSFSGDLSGWSLPTGLTYLALSFNSFSGDLSGWSLPAGLEYLYLYNDSFTVSTTFAGVGTSLRKFLIHDNVLIESHVDNVIESIWNARAGCTYASPELNVGGTNAPPSGSYVAPAEGANWHDDGGTWVPLTGAAMAYDLVNDVNAEGFNKWTVTISS